MKRVIDKLTAKRLWSWLGMLGLCSLSVAEPLQMENFENRPKPAGTISVTR